MKKVTGQKEVTPALIEKSGKMPAAVDDTFGTEIEYTMLVKTYGNERQGEARFSHSVCMRARKAVITGNPEVKHITTSLTEWSNLTKEMSMRRFTCLTNVFSKKL